MFSPLRRGARLPMTVLALALANWSLTGPAAYAHGGGGGHGGGGHGGGGHSGRHSGGHAHGGHHYGGYYHGGHHGYYPNNFYIGGGYGGYGYGYNFPYFNYGYTYPNFTYSYTPGYFLTYGSAAPSVVATAPIQGRFLGIDEQPVVDPAGTGMQVMRVYTGSAAEQAGLQAGDIILSANGYLTQQHGNLTWIIGTLPSNGVLQMNVRTARDGALHIVAARMP